MAKKTKAAKAAEAAMDAAAAAAKNAKRVSRTLPTKDAKKLRAVAEEAKEASRASKKTIVRHPRKVQKRAAAAIDRVEKAADKAEGKLAAKKSAAGKKAGAAKKSASRKAKHAQSEPVAATSAKADSLGDQNATTEPLHAVIETSGIEPAGVEDESALPAVPTRTPTTEDLSSLTVLQLRTRARDAGHAGFSRYTKAQLLALLSS
jgi:hypothetical protein